MPPDTEHCALAASIVPSLISDLTSAIWDNCATRPMYNTKLGLPISSWLMRFEYYCGGHKYSTSLESPNATGRSGIIMTIECIPADTKTILDLIKTLAPS